MRPLVLLASLVVSLVNSASFDDSVRKCEAERLTDLNMCMFKAVDEDVKPFIAKGIPELGVPVWDPGFINNVEILLGDFSSTCTALQLRGLSKWITDTVTSDPATMKMKVRLTFPELRLTGQYKLKGRIFSLPIEGTGPFWSIISDVTADFNQNLAVNQTPVGSRMKIEGRSLVLGYGKIRTRLNKLFNGDPILGETVNAFVNENHREFFKAFEKALQEPVSEVIYKITNHIVSRVSADKFLRLRSSS